jgi:hypothetical protein
MTAGAKLARTSGAPMDIFKALVLTIGRIAPEEKAFGNLRFVEAISISLKKIT